MQSDGPIASANAATNYFALAQYISGRHYQCTRMGLLHWQMLLPITSIGPIRFLGGTANAFGWAHCIGGCCCQLLCFGPLYFWEELPMHSHAPIAFADPATNYLALAHYISGKLCQCTQIGPLHWQIFLLIIPRPPRSTLVAYATPFRSAYCTGRCCCRLHRLGPSDFWEALPMHLDGPIALVDAAANYFALAHYISGKSSRCTHMHPLHSQILLPIT